MACTVTFSRWIELVEQVEYADRRFEVAGRDLRGPVFHRRLQISLIEIQLGPRRSAADYG